MISYNEARQAFSSLLDWHLTNGTRPGGHNEKDRIAWKNSEFARALKARFTPKAVLFWRTGRHHPRTWILDHIERALFGDAVAGQYATWREDLRTAYLRKEGEEPPDPSGAVIRSTPTQSADYSDGDWITAAIVGPERAEAWLKGAAARLNRLSPEHRTVESVENYIQTKIDDLLAQHQKGGSTDDARLEACVAKVVLDILSRELGNFLWNVGEKSSTEDVVSIFRDTVRELAKKPGTSSASRKAEAVPTERDTGDKRSSPAKSGTSAGDLSRERDATRSERNERLVATLKAHAGIEDCWVMQLEDHSDKGYLVSVDFDPTRRSAADTASLIRNVLDDMDPPVPFWGEIKTETENSVSFAYTYIDKYNKAIRRFDK